LGFPKDYTKIIGISALDRKKILGDTFAVPVVVHLLSPLQKTASMEEEKLIVIIQEPILRQTTLTQQYRI
jgi:hypothetical protein